MREPHRIGETVGSVDARRAEDATPATLPLRDLDTDRERDVGALDPHPGCLPTAAGSSGGATAAASHFGQ